MVGPGRMQVDQLPPVWPLPESVHPEVLAHCLETQSPPNWDSLLGSPHDACRWARDSQALLQDLDTRKERELECLEFLWATPEGYSYTGRDHN